MTVTVTVTVTGKEKYHDRKSRGVCVSCGHERDCEKLDCFDCRLRKKQTYDKRKEIGLCVRCGTADQAPGRKQCKRCLAELVKRRMAYEVRHMQEGKCRHCPRPADGGKQTCRWCRKTRSTWAKESYHLRRMKREEP